MSVGSIDTLRQQISGYVIAPTDAQYDEARTIFNAMIDRHPRLIVQCKDTDDVIAAIRFARDHDLEIAVRGGGHGVAGRALNNDGLVIDLRHMNAVTVDPAARTVTVAGGATMSHLDRGTEPFGLATTGGRVSTTGVGGFILGGGSGWLDRKLGLASDNLVAAEIVTAEGKIVSTSADQHPELFWALHGGGGNFGVATSFTLRLHELSNVTAALLLWPPEAGSDVIRSYRDFMQSAADEVGGGILYLTGPEEEFVPASLVGKLALAILIVYAGPEAEARQAIAPLLTLGHQGEFIAEMPYADLQCMLDDPPGYRNYWSAEHLHSLPDQAVELFCARAQDMVIPSPSQHVLFPQGGVVGRGPTEYPIPWRNAEWVAHPFGLWTDPADDEQARRWAQNVRADLKPWSINAVYLNFIGDEGDDRVVAGYGPENYARLVRVKTEYDPNNVFHLNHNIKPAQLAHAG